MRWYVGWDQRDALAFEVCKATLIEQGGGGVEVIALKDWELRARGLYWRDYYVAPNGQMWDRNDDKPFSTAFSFTRFLVPALEDYGSEPVGFCDADMLWRYCPLDLKDFIVDVAVACVKHNHNPTESTKMTSNIQTKYPRKNWSSLMVMIPDRCRILTPYIVNNKPGSWLHGMNWVEDREIKGLDESWNWLEGWSDPSLEPKVVHFTRGTPDMKGYENSAYADEWREVAENLVCG